ncbi:hypothetical protein ACFS6G_06145, partial [Peribacillus deserti]|uniref:hypothetical protein n=1 Tax=Peribacillus deserti TaxID=673318 RepID=UPI003637B4BE
LSSLAPMVVGGSPPVRVGRCQATRRSAVIAGLFLLLYFVVKTEGENIKIKINKVNRTLRMGRDKEVEEATERGPECTLYMRTGVREADEEIRRPSPFRTRTRKLSS